MSRSTILLTVTLVAVASLAIGGFAASLTREVVSEPLRQPLMISACPPETFLGSDCTTGAPDPSVLALTDDLLIEVAGRVCNEETVAYQVTVAWVAVDSDESFETVDAPVTYDMGCQPPYGVGRSTFEGWRPPAGLLEFAADEPPGADLGRWRIVGTARPVRGDTYATYQWDSVKTFVLVKG